MKRKTSKPSVTVTVDDERSGRSAGAIATASSYGKNGTGTFRQVDATIEAYNDKTGIIGPDAGSFVVCRIHSGDRIGEMRHVKVSFSDASLGDLPLIALALQGALREGIRTGSFPALDGAK